MGRKEVVVLDIGYYDYWVFKWGFFRFSGEFCEGVHRWCL